MRRIALALLAAHSLVSLAQMPVAPIPPGQMPFVHDPSTVIHSGGMYYVFTTGRGAPILSSPDGFTWTRGGSVFTQIPDDVRAGSPGNNGTDVWAPDIIKVGGQFYLYYAVSSWGSFVSAVGLATTPTLDAKDPAYKWTDRGIVVQSREGEDLNAIDPGVIHAPDGTMWLSYGSYHGTIQLVELDPKTGLRLHPNQKATVIASQSESSDIIAHNGYFYLFTNHGSCCQGKDSAYNLRVGRSRKVTGPYLDKHGLDMAKGNGSLFLAAADHRIGPGHFGRVIEEGTQAAPAERFSMHYEADTEIGGRSVLDIRPLLWSVDDWPIAGDHLAAAPYQIRSAQSEDVLDLHVDTPPPPPRVRNNAPRPNAPAVAGATPLPPAPPAPPAPPPAPAAPFVPKPTVLRLARYVTLEDQKWKIAPVAGGYSKIVNLMTGDALQVPEGTTTSPALYYIDTPPMSLQVPEGTTTSPASAPVWFAPYTGGDNQLWQLDQLPDATYRIRNKATRLTLTAPDHSAPGHPNEPMATAFAADDLHKWIIAAP